MNTALGDRQSRGQLVGLHLAGCELFPDPSSQLFGELGPFDLASVSCSLEQRLEPAPLLAGGTDQMVGIHTVVALTGGTTYRPSGMGPW